MVIHLAPNRENTAQAFLTEPRLVKEIPKHPTDFDSGRHGDWIVWGEYAMAFSVALEP